LLGRLGRSDNAGAKAFYSEMFGWQQEDRPAGPSMTYTILNRDNQPIAALFQLGEEQTKAGVPAHWQCYVSVTNIDEFPKKIVELDGKVCMEPFDVTSAGRMLELQDPTGASLQLWQAKDHPELVCATK
jgi:uncharacterized protein